MSLEREIKARSGNACELCTATENLSILIVAPKTGVNKDECVHVCSTCKGQIEDPSTADANHWRCLNDSMWSQEAPVQVMAWRMLYQLRAEGWPQDLLDMMYMDEETEKWAKELAEAAENAVVHKDSNGVVLQAGDTVVLIKDLKVKGSSMVAKRGTAVRRISLDRDNANHIEGRVEGQHIVILTEFVKKSKEKEK